MCVQNGLEIGRVEFESPGSFCRRAAYHTEMAYANCSQHRQVTGPRYSAHVCGITHPRRSECPCHSRRCKPLSCRVPRAYLSWANPAFLAFFPFNRINNLRVFNVAFSPIPTPATTFCQQPPSHPTLSFPACCPRAYFQINP